MKGKEIKTKNGKENNLKIKPIKKTARKDCTKIISVFRNCHKGGPFGQAYQPNVFLGGIYGNFRFFLGGQSVGFLGGVFFICFSFCFFLVSLCFFSGVKNRRKKWLNPTKLFSESDENRSV